MNRAIGEILKNARREQGLKLPDVSTKLCISKTYLRALESNDEEKLPAQTFTIGFLRTYATHLGLDADQLVNKAKGSAPKEAPAVEVNVPEPEQDSTMPNIMVLVAITGAIASLASGYTYFANNSENIVVAETKPQELLASAELLQDNIVADSKLEIKFTNSEKVETAAVEVVSVEQTVPAVNEAEQFVEIRAVDDTWVMIAGMENNNIYNDIIHKGDAFQATVGKGLRLTTGNAGGLEFYHSGQQLPVPSGHGVILNAIALDQVILEPNASNSQQQELSP